MYAINDLRSFERVGNWINQIQNDAPKNVKFILVGNKCDLE